MYYFVFLSCHASSPGKDREEKPFLNGTVEQKENEKKYGQKLDKIRTLPTTQSITHKAIDRCQRRGDDSAVCDTKPLYIDGKDDVPEAVNSKETERCDIERPGLNKRVSSSLDDLKKEVENEQNGEKVKPFPTLENPKAKRPVSLNLERLESPKEEGSKLADILDSIKKATEKTKSSSNVSLASLNDIDVKMNGQDSGLLNPNKSSLQTKSYSYSCLADLKLGDDGNPIQEQTPG